MVTVVVVVDVVVLAKVVVGLVEVVVVGGMAVVGSLAGVVGHPHHHRDGECCRIRRRSSFHYTKNNR